MKGAGRSVGASGDAGTSRIANPRRHPGGRRPWWQVGRLHLPAGATGVGSSRHRSLLGAATAVLVVGLVVAACGTSTEVTAPGAHIGQRLHSATGRATTSQSAPSSPASSATPTLRSPGPLTYGRHGTLYVADPATNQVWALSPGDSPRLVAGTGTAGFSGMGGPALDAALDRPEGLAKIGSILYIADTGANRVLAVNATGIVNVVAGSGATASGMAPAGGPALSTAIGPNLFGVAPGPQGSLFIATANEILELQRASLSVVIAGTSILGVDPHFPDAAQCDPSGVALSGGGNLYFVCANVDGLFERQADGTLSYLGQFRSHGVALLGATPSGSVIGATGGVVSIAHGAMTVVETFPATLADVGPFQAEYVAEAPTGTFAADQSGGDGIGPPAIITFTSGTTPSVLWPT